MKIPKVEFKEMSLQENIDVIKWAYYEDNGLLSVRYYTINYFPELAHIDDKLSKEEVYKTIEEVVTDDYEKYNRRIKEETKRYNLLWGKYNDIYFKELSNFLSVDWPENLDIIEAKVGLIPVFPRYLEDFSFSISTGVDDWKLIETTAHETLHFLWFEKWKKIHPETPIREYNSPYLVWQYSEMVTDPILNNKPFSNIFNFRETGYDSFYQIYDGNVLVMEKLIKNYENDIPIEEKIEEGYEYLKKVIL